MTGEGNLIRNFSIAKKDSENTIIYSCDENKTYKGTFELKTYTVLFYNGDTLLQEVSVSHGFDAVYTENTPTKTGDIQYSYVFEKWLNYEDSMLVEEDIEFVALYSEETIKKMAVKDETYNIEINLDEKIANQITLKVTQKDNLATSQLILSNDYENIVNLIVYKITLIDSNQLEIDNLESYANIKIGLPDTVHKKNLVIYNLTTQKTISYELSSNYAICELNTLGEIALFNSSNDANGGTFAQSTNTIMLILIGSNVAMLIAVLLLAFVKKKREN